ncbi:MAG: PP2C family protein-serine/threonine phosphatase [Thermoanaerobaculia bacterium]
MTSPPSSMHELEIAAVSDTGTERDHNEDFCAAFAERNDCAIVGVADGVSSEEGGEVASQIAIEAMLRAYREEPPTLGSGPRLYRAVQQANIEIYDRAMVVPELRGMSTTLTAVAVERGELTAVHVGDSRLYLIRGGAITQLTKDHTLAAERTRMGLLSEERARSHADRSTLTRSVGRELIVNRDRISRPLAQGDVVLLCSDGLYNVLSDVDIERIVAGREAPDACRALIDAANRRGTPDNLTTAVVRVTGPTPGRPESAGLAETLHRLLTRRSASPRSR